MKGKEFGHEDVFHYLYIDYFVRPLCIKPIYSILKFWEAVPEFIADEFLRLTSIFLNYFCWGRQSSVVAGFTLLAWLGFKPMRYSTPSHFRTQYLTAIHSTSLPKHTHHNSSPQNQYQSTLRYAAPWLTSYGNAPHMKNITECMPIQPYPASVNN